MTGEILDHFSEADIIQMLDQQCKLQDLLNRDPESADRSSRKGSSITDLIKFYLRSNRVSKAEEIRDSFRISQKRYCFILVQHWTEQQNWQELYRMAKKKSPIPFEWWVHHLVDHVRIQIQFPILF